MRSIWTVMIFILATTFTEVAFSEIGTSQSERIRTEYKGSATPDHIVFGYALLSIQKMQAENPEIATTVIQKKMGLDSAELADDMLGRLVAAASELKAEWAAVKQGVVCAQNAPRTKEGMYAALDRVDDLKEVASHNLYTKFISSLEDWQQEAVGRWLTEKKRGFYYRTAEHESLYENSDYDIVGYVDMVCADRRGDR